MLFHLTPGVTTVDANVEAKTVIVDHDASVTSEALLESLMKVRFR
jgi:copper chaperone CopZ